MTTGVVGLAISDVSFGQGNAGSKEVAFTFDDPQVVDYSGYPAADVDARLRAALRELNLKTVLFVCGTRVDNEAGRRLLQAWNDDGHVLGNHSYSHPYFHSEKLSLRDFQSDVLRGENVVRGYSRFQKIFRFPFFKEGETVEKRDGMRWWLAEHGYRNGRATIDASDWAIDARLKKRLESDANANLSPYRDFYIEHILQRSNYYDGLAQKAWGKPVRHTVLLHHRLLNALFLKDLATAYRNSGWKIIDADRAYTDAIYAQQPNVLPAGESLVWGVAKERGIAGLRYPGEDDSYENPEMDRRQL